MQTWRKYVEMYAALIEIRRSLIRSGHDLIAEVQTSLGEPDDRAAALAFVPFLPPSAQIQIVPSVVTLALFVHGLTEEARATVSAMPRDAVLSHLNTREASGVGAGDYEEVACLLELHLALGNSQKAAKLAEAAAQSASEDVRDVANAFLARHSPADKR